MERTMEDRAQKLAVYMIETGGPSAPLPAVRDFQIHGP